MKKKMSKQYVIFVDPENKKEEEEFEKLLNEAGYPWAKMMCLKTELPTGFSTFKDAYSRSGS